MSENNTSPRRDPRAARRGEQRTQPTLEDLRTTLRKVMDVAEVKQSGSSKKADASPSDAPHAAQNTQTQQPQTGEKHTPPSPPQNEKSSQAHTQLREALTGVLHHPPIQTPPQRSQGAETSAARPQSPPVSAKELERMMRINTNDKPPRT